VSTVATGVGAVSVTVGIPLVGLVGVADHERQLVGRVGGGVHHNATTELGDSELGVEADGVGGDAAGIVIREFDPGVSAARRRPAATHAI
jgi:hypothetical protein